MVTSERPPGGPRGAVGADAEEAAAAWLRALDWTVLARNLRIAGCEVDIVALEPGHPPMLVIVEVRSRSGLAFGRAVESVDARKVARLYRAAWSLQRRGGALLAGGGAASTCRVDLVAMGRDAGGGWSVEAHVRGLLPP